MTVFAGCDCWYQCGCMYLTVIVWLLMVCDCFIPWHMSVIVCHVVLCVCVMAHVCALMRHGAACGCGWLRVSARTVSMDERLLMCVAVIECLVTGGVTL